MSDGGKGSARRPGDNYEQNWERIFGNGKRIRLQEQQEQDRLAGIEQERQPQPQRQQARDEAKGQGD